MQYCQNVCVALICIFKLFEHDSFPPQAKLKLREQTSQGKEGKFELLYRIATILEITFEK